MFFPRIDAAGFFEAAIGPSPQQKGEMRKSFGIRFLEHRVFMVAGVEALPFTIKQLRKKGGSE